MDDLTAMAEGEECPECGERGVTRDAGPLPVCRACDWTGWAVEDECDRDGFDAD